MRSVFFLFSAFSFHCCIAQQQYSIHDLKTGKYVNDTSYVYSLPFVNNKKVFLVQGYFSKMSHKGEYALDFKVRKKTKVCAARDGIVIAARGDSNKGGLKPENLSDGNYITIRHADSSIAHYWHLKENGALVKVGDTIQKGQLIGLSGNTGYSAFPHLHFEVMASDGNGAYTQIPTRFSTNKGIVYLRPAHFYRTK